VHVWFVQADAAPHVPLAVQVSTELPEHCVSPGEHTPVQAPPRHVWLIQAEGGPKVPPAVQVSTELPEQVVCPGEQLPEHAPAEQVESMHGTAAPQLPLVGSHVCTPLPLHCV
jgi:hypothetical protein